MTATTVMTARASAEPVVGLSTLAQEMLPVLYQHRLVSTSQLQALLLPHSRTSRYLRSQLGVLRDRGLVSSTVRRQAGQGELLSYITALGREVVEGSGEITPRAYRMSDKAAANQLQHHTLALNDAAITFVEAARQLGHSCGPLDWWPEVAHRMRDGQDRHTNRAFLIPDAVLRYTRVAGPRRELLTFFVELDRATEHPAVLAGKVASYLTYSQYRPGGTGGREAWRAQYPDFPRLLIVLTGRGENALRRRAADVRALLASEPRLERAGGLRGGITTLHQLQQQGPFSPVVTPLFGAPDPTDVLDTKGSPA